MNDEQIRILSPLDYLQRETVRNANWLYEQGRKMYEQKNLPLAAAHLLEALNIDPGSPHAPYALHVCAAYYQTLGQFERAIDAYTRAMVLSTDACFAYERGRALVQVLRYQEAIADLTVVIQAQYQLFDAHVLRAFCYKETKQYELCIADSKQAHQLNPASGLPPLFLSECSLRTEDVSLALEYVSEAIRLDPRLPSPYALRGEICWRTGNNATALVDIDQALRLSPSLDMARFVRLCVRFGDSLPQADPATFSSMPAADLAIYFEQAYCCLTLRRPDNALKLARQALVLSQGRMPASAKLLTIIGCCCCDLGQYAPAMLHVDEAIHFYNRFDTFNHELAEAHYQRAVIHYKSGSSSKALADSGEAIRLDPKRGEFYFQKALALKQLNLPNRAATALTQAIVLEPTNAQYLTARGELYAEKCLPRRAIRDCNLAIELSPDWNFMRAVAYLTKVECLIELERWRTAFVDVNILIRCFDNPDGRIDMSEAYEFRARCYELYGKRRLACKDRREACRLKREWDQRFRDPPEGTPS